MNTNKNKNDFTAQPSGARYGTGTIASHPSLHLPLANDNSLAVAPPADGDGGGGQALLPPIDAATMSLLEANGANNANDGIDWGETSSPNDDDLGLLFWDDINMAPDSGTGDDPLSFGLGTRTGSAPSTAPVPAAPQPPSPVARLSPMPVDGNASQVQQQPAFAGAQAVVNGSASGGDPLLRVSNAAAQGQGIHAVQQANPAVQQVQANPQAQYQIQYIGGVPVLTQVVPGQQLQQQQRRQNLIQAIQMMNPQQQLQFAQAQQLSQAQTVRTQQQQAAQTQQAQAQQLAQAAQLQKAQPQTIQQAQQQETESAVKRLHAPSNQTLQPQVQAQNQVQQNLQLTSNGRATAYPIPQAMDQPINAVVSQPPQVATIPASAQPYYLWLLQQQQALQAQQAQTAQVAQGVVGFNGQTLAINQMQILQALQLNQAQNGTAFPQQAHAIQATQDQVSNQPVVQGIDAIQHKVPQSVPAHLKQLYDAQQDALKHANDEKSKNPARRKPKKGSYQELEASLGDKLSGTNTNVALAPNQSGGAKPDTPQDPTKHARPAPVAQVTALAPQTLVQMQHRQGIPAGSVASVPFAITHQQHHSHMSQAVIQPPLLSKPSAMPAHSQPPNPLVSSDTEASKPRKKRRVSASTSVRGLRESTAEEKGVKAKPVKPGTAIHRPLTDEERAELTRERNREHAKNTRLRKKAYVEHLKTSVDELCRERDSLTAERANEAQALVDTHSKRIAVLRSFFALRAGYNIHQHRELWESILDESSFHAVCPVTPYQSFPSSEVQVANCQRTILGVDAMISDAASNYIFLDSLIDRSKYPNARIKFQYTLVTEEAVVSGNQLMARWSMATTNAKKCGSAIELKQSGMLVAKFNSAHKIVTLEFMFDVMAFMLQIKMAMGYSNFNDVVIPNTYQTCQKDYYFPAVTTEARRSHTIVQVNSRWEQMTGYKSEEVVGKASCSILQGADSSRNEIKQLMSPVMYKRPSCAMLTNYTKSGRKFRQYITIYPLSTDSNITHYLGLTTFVQWLDDRGEVAEKIESSDDMAT